jgi:hypothetical protein
LPVSSAGTRIAGAPHQHMSQSSPPIPTPTERGGGSAQRAADIMLPTDPGALQHGIADDTRLTSAGPATHGPLWQDTWKEGRADQPSPPAHQQPDLDTSAEGHTRYRSVDAWLQERTKLLSQAGKKATPSGQVSVPSSNLEVGWLQSPRMQELRPTSFLRMDYS